MPFRDSRESSAQEIIFRDHFPHVQTIVQTLNSVRRRTATDVLDGEDAMAAHGKVASNLRNDVRQVVGDGRLIEVQRRKENRCLGSPFAYDFFLAAPEYLGQMLDGAVF